MSTTRKTSARKNRRTRKAAANHDTAVLINVGRMEAIHAFLDRLVHSADPDSSWSEDEAEDLARASLHVVRDGERFSRGWIEKLTDGLEEALTASSGETISLDVKTAGVLGRVLTRILGDEIRGFHIDGMVERLIEQGEERKRIDVAVAAALAARAQAPRPEDLAPDLLPGGLVRCFAIVAGGRCAGLDGHQGDHYPSVHGRSDASAVPCECRGGVEVR